MSGWSGFTDEELSRIQTNKKERNTAAGKSTSLGGNRRAKPKEKLVTLSQKKKQTEAIESEKSSSQQSVTVTPQQTIVKHSTESAMPITDNKMKHADQIKMKENEDDAMPGILSDERAAEIELSSLQLMQKKQKEMEAQNMKKKQLIKNTIKERYQKAQAETQVLQHVQKELGKLDQRLASDVELLRVKIEESSIDYHHAQKRYEKAEAEFIASKMDLHAKSEVKDDLTHHLYTIIQENEERKAKKLEEIMTKLSLDGDYEIPSSPVEKEPPTHRPTPIQHPVVLPLSKIENVEKADDAIVKTDTSQTEIKDLT